METGKRKKQFLPSALLALAVFVVCAGSGEIAIRSAGHEDASGQFYFNGEKIRPIVLLSESDLVRLENRANVSANSYLRYDPNLGWSIVPNIARNESSASLPSITYRSNSERMRADNDFSLLPANNTIRIAIFGDSFVHGDEVELNETWGYSLEKSLARKGIKTEVINFGVPGYGNDQAYLRYLLQGRAYYPDVVIIGFQAENLGRNVNLFRPFYNPSTQSLHFSKPRFIEQDGSLTLINVPAIPPEKIESGLRGGSEIF